MREVSRRLFVSGAALAATSLAATAGSSAAWARSRRSALGNDSGQLAPPEIDPEYLQIYASIDTEPFPVPAIDLRRIGPDFLRRRVDYPTAEQPGTIIVDPHEHFLYLVLDDGSSVRYGVGVGKEGFGWSGTATINVKQEWPDWYPPKEMIQRQPELRHEVSELQSGLGVPGGSRNPLGARAMYLWEDNKDTLYRIHGTVEPWSIGHNASSGCIRMMNQDAMNLYDRVDVGTKVVVL